MPEEACDQNYSLFSIGKTKLQGIDATSKAPNYKDRRDGKMTREFGYPTRPDPNGSVFEGKKRALDTGSGFFLKYPTGSGRVRLSCYRTRTRTRTRPDNFIL
jgi:hypothetical protein